MSRATTILVLLVVALFILLSRYELADIGKGWPHDGFALPPCALRFGGQVRKKRFEGDAEMCVSPGVSLMKRSLFALVAAPGVDQIAFAQDGSSDVSTPRHGPACRGTSAQDDRAWRRLAR
jgi:hypothetical protein